MSEQREATEVTMLVEGDVLWVADVRAAFLFGVSFLSEWFPHYGEGGVKSNSLLVC